MAGRRRQFGSIRRLPSGRWQARSRNTSGRLVPAPRTFATKETRLVGSAGSECQPSGTGVGTDDAETNLYYDS